MPQGFRKLTGVVLVMAGCLASGPVLADRPPPFPDFSAKRVTPPAPGTTRRITVQIAPAPLPRAVAPPTAAPKEEAPVTGAHHDWFWREMSPDLAASGPGRLDAALVALRNAPRAVASPRLQTLQGIAAARGVDILRATIGTEVSPALVLAVIAVESAGRADAVSGAGAQGLMQLMPATAARFSVTDPFLPGENIRGGVAYLDWLMKRFDRDPLMVLAAYNAGEGAVQRHAGVPPFAETRDYVPKVLSAFATARGLCSTPPQLISDGCVFAVMN